MKPKAVVLLSGGLDSAVALAHAQDAGYECAALSFDYGQRHRIELECAKRQALHQMVKDHRTATIDLRLFGGSALTADVEVPKDRDLTSPEIPITYVPARNTIFLSFALGFAEVFGAGTIVTGMNAVDYSGYPDCRSAFIASAQQTISLALDSDFRIHTPLMHLSKAQTWLLADELGGTQLVREHSHTCYEGNRSALHPWGYGCGKCAACELRARGYYEAFPAGPANHLP